MLSDLLSLLLSLFAMILATHLATKVHTYGLHRTEIFAAFINGILLVAISRIIIWKAYRRFLSPAPIQGGIMMGIVVIGLIANLTINHLLHGSHDLNMRNAFLHLLGDTLSSVALIGAAVWIYFTSQVIIGTAFRILIETVSILLQLTPRSVSFDEVIEEIKSVSGVEDVRHLHLLGLCLSIHELNTHF